MKKKDIDKITAMLRESGDDFLLFTGDGESLLTACQCSPEELYVFLMSLTERMPVFKGIIIGVAEKLMSVPEEEDVIAN